MTTEATTQQPISPYESIPYQKGLKTRHTVMAVLALPLALILTVFSMLGVMAVFVPIYWSEISEILDEAVASGSSELATSDIVALIANAGEFLAVATIFQFLAFFVTAIIAKYVVSGRNIKHLFSPSTYRGFFAKFGLPTVVNKQLFKHLLFGALLGLGMWVVLQAVGFIIAQTGGEPLSSETSQSIANTGSLLLLLFVVPILGPIAEELLFRGYILGFLVYPDPKNNTRKIAALIFSSLLFSAMHFQGLASTFDFFVLFWTFTLGMVFGISYLKTGKITVAIAGHIAYNGITSLLIVIPMYLM